MDISIDASEVIIQLYQTLLKGSVQFPLSISPDGRYFTVLRTLYSLVGEGQAMHCTSATIPLQLNELTKMVWAVPGMDDKGYRVHDYSRFGKQNLLTQVYLYWVYFDDLGQDICVAEQIRYNPITFSVFQIQRSPSQSRSPDLTLVAQCRRWMTKLESPYWHQDTKDFELAFHPFLPVIALAGSGGTYIWNYATGNDILESLLNHSPNLT
jgi:hypothetical protein